MLVRLPDLTHECEHVYDNANAGYGDQRDNLRLTVLLNSPTYMTVPIFKNELLKIEVVKMKYEFIFSF